MHLAELYSGQVCGSIQTAISVEAALPGDHPFGTECKATNVGNPTPAFHYHYLGGQGGAISNDVCVQVRFRFAVGGVGIPCPYSFS